MKEIIWLTPQELDRSRMERFCGVPASETQMGNQDSVQAASETSRRCGIETNLFQRHLAGAAGCVKILFCFLFGWLSGLFLVGTGLFHQLGGSGHMFRVVGVQFERLFFARFLRPVSTPVNKPSRATSAWVRTSS